MFSLSGGGGIFQPIVGQGRVITFPDAQLRSGGGKAIGADIYFLTGSPVYFSTGITTATEKYTAHDLDPIFAKVDYEYQYLKIPFAIHWKSETSYYNTWWHMKLGGALRYGDIKMQLKDEVTNPMLKAVGRLSNIKDYELFGGFGYTHALGRSCYIDYSLTMHISPFRRSAGEEINEQPSKESYNYTAKEAFTMLSKGYPMLTVKIIPGAVGSRSAWSRSCK